LVGRCAQVNPAQVDPPQLFSGEGLTFPIEWKNGPAGGFRRRIKAASKRQEMVDLSVRIFHYFGWSFDNFAAKAVVFPG